MVVKLFTELCTATLCFWVEAGIENARLSQWFVGMAKCDNLGWLGNNSTTNF
jgi:hypothetical protein